ncbi:MAG: hypothetical protein K6T85_11605 [Gorillibacterium sp.]|nr:hypothetical protein [Gorillibacterium sp.]
MTVSTHSTAWVNDQLDLYNYAKTIGDSAWQQAILELLQHKDEYIDKEAAQILLNELWHMFDLVNSKMLQLFHQMHNTLEQDQQEELREKVWRLKLQRIEITRMIRSI